jgi:hypothetical protein
MTENPKLKNSNIIDCIPQTKECPLNCAECFYNGGRFYRTIDEPLMPSVEQVKGKVVRVNSGNDSNIHREQVIEQTKQYPKKFYNTSLPNFDFPAPVVFTCNGRELILAEKCLENLMFVRIRTSIFDLDNVDKAVQHYLVKHKVPVVLTFMRYYDIGKIPDGYLQFFEFKKHVLNSYYCHTLEAHLEVLQRYKGLGVRMCGTLVSSLCCDCRNCELLYLLFNSEK